MMTFWFGLEFEHTSGFYGKSNPLEDREEKLVRHLSCGVGTEGVILSSLLLHPHVNLKFDNMT